MFFNETVGTSPLNSILFVLIQQYIHSQVFQNYSSEMHTSYYFSDTYYN